MTFWVHWLYQVSWLTKLGHANRAPKRPACLSGRTHLSDCDMLLILTFISPSSSLGPPTESTSSSNMADIIWLPYSRMLHMCEAKLLGLNFVVFHNLTSSCFTFHYSSKCSSSLGLGNTAHLMLLSHWWCLACSPLLASSTTIHLQNTPLALLTPPCPPSASTQESNFLLCSVVILDVAHLCALMLLWAPRKASLAEGRPSP